MFGGLKKLTLTVSTLGRCGGLERTDFNSFYLWEGVAVLKELILTVSTLEWCGGLKRTDFNSFYFGRCGSLERTDLTVSTLGRVWQS